MSRIANAPVVVPAGVEININAQSIQAKGPKGNLEMNVHPSVEIEREGEEIRVKGEGESRALAGTMRSLINNMVVGVHQGFERKLALVGVGYRAQMQGNKLNLTLGFSHPVDFEVPEGITIETPSQTEIIVRGSDKQKVGQTAAKIRAYRPPEPYKGKGVRYADEQISLKEAKKA